MYNHLLPRTVRFKSGRNSKDKVYSWNFRLVFLFTYLFLFHLSNIDQSSVNKARTYFSKVTFSASLLNKCNCFISSVIILVSSFHVKICYISTFYVHHCFSRNTFHISGCKMISL